MAFPSLSSALAGTERLLLNDLMHAVLHHTPAQALRGRLVWRNVCDAVDLPRVRPPEVTTLTAAEAHVVLNGTRGDDLERMRATALVTAMRLGEILAVRREDTNLERGDSRSGER